LFNHGACLGGDGQDKEIDVKQIPVDCQMVIEAAHEMLSKYIDLPPLKVLEFFNLFNKPNILISLDFDHSRSLSKKSNF